MEEILKNELIKKYNWAGKIRFICFSLLFFFLVLMKAIGDYRYLNTEFIALFFVEIFINQPYPFIVKRVNIYRLQFFQMVIDIIAISWIIYYLGGIEAPVVTIAYYAIILWAGVVSGHQAVFFAVAVSVTLFSLVASAEYFGILPRINLYGRQLPFAQMISQLLTNVAFMSAFGYFSAQSSKIIKSLERKKNEEAFKYTHRFLATGYLLSALAHDMMNHLASVKGYVQILLLKANGECVEDKEFNTTDILKKIEMIETENIGLLTKLSRFVKEQTGIFQPADINKVVEDVLELIAALARIANIKVIKDFNPDMPLVSVEKEQMQEALIVLILSAFEAMGYGGELLIQTRVSLDEKAAFITLSDSGEALRRDYLNKIIPPVLNNKDEEGGQDLGLAIVREIMRRHKGKIEIASVKPRGTSVTIELPMSGA